ncbi:sigma-70 family RNA polymerase sigma factor [Lactococcus formosensis]|uniref:Sigma-70 family RNA polymerase sigma factor n=1 Tax=Lactococcus formosensis TaxID=1281486 RepID=A0A9X4SHJ2_9LACT|nr:sigma factor-like helix-turn-helix DNA-binding protein [Lactococcus formosensis]MDG6142037.1 sigma-70 family RNA polymerase sigma factor [Lactococcus formosensis]MDG6159241.1 sigma-70 family RNA polymerase sigma factor [Lactococcus formosensis]MDG6165476.1 sigma-70 family RNA polymerase sigma factor [Lactococcus formosensis]MDG6171929.1 sigma-70 family RNA polymerase sigma factor [Lactococcus formosensis]MDG6192695.1 sigma-70 family RNA polymerase sigma factor [Lactococcus formosensis]
MTNYKFLIKFYLLGTLEESTSRAEKFVERFGGNDINIKRNRKTIDKLDEIFKPLNEQVRELVRLRFVDELKVKDVAEQTGLTYNKVYSLCADPIQEVKKLAKEYHKK